MKEMVETLPPMSDDITWTQPLLNVWMAYVENEDGDQIELTWTPNDPDWIGWAEYMVSRNDQVHYGNSGNDPVEEIYDVLGQLRNI